MPKLALISITLNAVIFAALLPFLEMSTSHLFNPEWPPHARLHEAWQLSANAALSILALVLVFKDRAPRIGMSIALIICFSFLLSWVSASTYGGSMLRSDGTHIAAVGGINAAVLIVMFLTMFLLLGYRSIANASRDDGI